jgi:hypothetical protein
MHQTWARQIKISTGQLERPIDEDHLPLTPWDKMEFELGMIMKTYGFARSE